MANHQKFDRIETVTTMPDNQVKPECETKTRERLKDYMARHNIDATGHRDDLPIGIYCSDIAPLRGSTHSGGERMVKRWSLDKRFKDLRFL
jgi:hypothetical protein